MEMGCSTSKENSFNEKTTAEQVLNAFGNQSIKGSLVVITGANVGLGKEAARVLSLGGAKVIMLSRSLKNGQEAANDIKKSNPDADLVPMQVDLASLKSIKAFTEKFLSEYSEINYLINNAGIMACPQSTTSDGLETQFGVNHIGHFYLTTLLLPAIIQGGKPDKPSRVVNLSSYGSWVFGPAQGINFDDINSKLHYSPWTAYGQSKFANIMFTKELNRRMAEQGHNVISVSLHPGTILGTKLTRSLDITSAAIMTYHAIGGGHVLDMLTEKYKSVEAGTATSIYCTLAPDIVPGEYYYDCGIGKQRHAKCDDAVIAKKLWEVSESIVSDITSRY